MKLSRREFVESACAATFAAGVSSRSLAAEDAPLGVRVLGRPPIVGEEPFPEPVVHPADAAEGGYQPLAPVPSAGGHGQPQGRRHPAPQERTPAHLTRHGFRAFRDTRR